LACMELKRKSEAKTKIIILIAFYLTRYWNFNKLIDF